jgi:hypothetical protein
VIRQEFDTELLDKIGNSESVRPFICYHDDEIDWYPVVRGCAVLSNGEDAVGIFEQTPKDHDIFKLVRPEMRAWQAHTLFDATCRGRKAIDTAKEMIRVHAARTCRRGVGRNAHEEPASPMVQPADRDEADRTRRLRG